MGSLRGELSARIPTAVYLDLADLDTLAAALGQAQGREVARTARKIRRARDRKRERARRAAR